MLFRSWSLCTSNAFATTRRYATRAGVKNAKNVKLSKLKAPVGLKLKKEFKFTANVSRECITPAHIEVASNLRDLFNTKEGDESVKEALGVRSDGLFPLSRLILQPTMGNLSFQVLNDVIRWDEERRFELLYRPKKLEPATEDWWIRIRRGQSQDRDLCLRRLPVDEVPPLVYITTPERYLRHRMIGIPVHRGPYLHLVDHPKGRETIFEQPPPLPQSSNARPSGDPKPVLKEDSTKVIIGIDPAKATEAGIPFYVSKRDTYAMTPGKSGYLPQSTFQYVQVRRVKKQRITDWTSDGTTTAASQSTSATDEASTTSTEPLNESGNAEPSTTDGLSATPEDPTGIFEQWNPEEAVPQDALDQNSVTKKRFAPRMNGILIQPRYA